VLQNHHLADETNASKPRLKVVAWWAVKHFKVATLLDMRGYYRDLLTELLNSSKVDASISRELGDHINEFASSGDILEDSELARTAKEVIGGIGGFSRFKVAEYNRKAGVVSTDEVIEKLSMTSNDEPYTFRSETLRQCFLGYQESQESGIADIIHGRIHGTGPGSTGKKKLMSNLVEIKSIAKKLNPTRLHLRPRDFGAFVGRISVQWTVQKYLEQQEKETSNIPSQPFGQEKETNSLLSRIGGWLGYPN
jgi:hypothetical protein